MARDLSYLAFGTTSPWNRSNLQIVSQSHNPDLSRNFVLNLLFELLLHLKVHMIIWERSGPCFKKIY